MNEIAESCRRQLNARSDADRARLETIRADIDGRTPTPGSEPVDEFLMRVIDELESLFFLQQTALEGYQLTEVKRENEA